MAYNLEPRTIKENLLGLIGKNPYAEPRPAKTREECFLADIAENGGGGSSLPPYTSADKGKALTVADVPNPPSVQTLIPEQIVTTDTETTILGQTVYKGDIVNADTSNIEDSYEYTLTVDGTDYYITFSDGLATEFDAGVAIQIEGSSCAMITFTNNETHTIKLTSVEQTSSANAGWFADGVAIVNITFDSASQSFSADKTFNEIAAAYNSGLKLYARADFTEDALTRLYHYDIGVDEYRAKAVGTVHDSYKNKAYLRTGYFAISSDGIDLVWNYYVELTAGQTP